MIPIVRVAPSPTGYLQVGNGRAEVLALALFAMLETGAQAATVPSNPYASCPLTMSEADYLRAGGKLTTISRLNLETFPSGILGKDCGGDVALSAVVLPDGTLVLGPHHHGVSCRTDAALMGEMEALVWRSGVIMDRLQSLRFEPPHLAGKPVCVAIESVVWKPNWPHRLFGDEAWRTRATQK